jgi:hypothetical protein
VKIILAKYEIYAIIFKKIKKKRGFEPWKIINFTSVTDSLPPSVWLSVSLSVRAYSSRRRIF